jgi:hypothetical protein
VDAKHVELHLDEEKPEGVVNEAAEQIAYADRIILNKTDLVGGRVGGWVLGNVGMIRGKGQEAFIGLVLIGQSGLLGEINNRSQRLHLHAGLGCRPLPNCPPAAPADMCAQRCCCCCCCLLPDCRWRLETCSGWRSASITSIAWRWSSEWGRNY